MSNMELDRRVGVIELLDLVPFLEDAGFQVITGPDVPSAVKNIQQAFQQGAFPILVADSDTKGLKDWAVVVATMPNAPDVSVLTDYDTGEHINHEAIITVPMPFTLAELADEAHLGEVDQQLADRSWPEELFDEDEDREEAVEDIVEDDQPAAGLPDFPSLGGEDDTVEDGQPQPAQADMWDATAQHRQRLAHKRQQQQTPEQVELVDHGAVDKQPAEISQPQQPVDYRGQQADDDFEGVDLGLDQPAVQVVEPVAQTPPTAPVSPAPQESPRRAARQRQRTVNNQMPQPPAPQPQHSYAQPQPPAAQPQQHYGQSSLYDGRGQQYGQPMNTGQQMPSATHRSGGKPSFDNIVSPQSGAQQSGAGDFMAPQPRPFVRKSRLSQCPMIFFSGAKGGVGKSTFARQAAITAAAAGYRTVLIDGDLGQANVPKFLNMDTRSYNVPTISDMAIHGHSLEQIMLTADKIDSLRPRDAVPVPDNLAVVLAPGRDDTRVNDVKASHYAQVVAECRERFDMVIFDSQIMKTTDEFLLTRSVIVPEVRDNNAFFVGLFDGSNVSLEDLVNRIEMLDGQGIDRKRILFAMNRAPAKPGVAERLDEYLRTNLDGRIGIYVGVVVSDARIPQLINAGEPDVQNTQIDNVIYNVLFRATGNREFDKQFAAPSFEVESDEVDVDEGRKPGLLSRVFGRR